jgi:phage tail sheath gpL-like
MTTVPFNNVPGNTLVPFASFEFNSGGTPYSGETQELLVGQMTSTGNAPAGVPYGPIASTADAIARFGLGSMLVSMYNTARLQAPTQEIWALPLVDPAGAAAAGSILFTAPGVAGAALIEVMGRLVAWQVNASDTASTIATNAVAAVNALSLPVVAAVDITIASKMDLTARHIGALGNNISVALVTNQPNVLQSANATIAPMSGGSGIPTLTTPLANCGSMPFDWIASAYSDSTSLTAIQGFLSDASGRWSSFQQIYGHHITVAAGTLSTQTTLGSGRNNQHETVMGVQVFRTPPWEWAAALGGAAVQNLGTAPQCSVPMQGIVLQGVLPPFDRTKWWQNSDLQALYSYGIAGFTVNSSGNVVINRMVTTYKTNSANAPDQTFMDTETMAQGMFALRYFESTVQTQLGRKAFAAENPFNVATIITPADVAAVEVHAYTDLVALGVTQDAASFATFLVVEQNAINPSRCDSYLPLEFVAGLRIFAANVTAFLQYYSPSGAPLAALANP